MIYSNTIELLVINYCWFLTRLIN